MTRKDVKDFTNAIIIILLVLFSVWVIFDLAEEPVLGVEIEEN